MPRSAAARRRFAERKAQRTKKPAPPKKRKDVPEADAPSASGTRDDT